MHPHLLGDTRIYFLVWPAAAAAGISFGCFLARKEGFSTARSALVLILWALAILVGSKLLYLFEYLVTPADDVFRLKGSIVFSYGFRIPGGLILLALSLPLAGRLTGLPWRRFSDQAIACVGLAVVVIRTGCFLNGCCFGKVSSVPWALRFPAESRAHWYHAYRGWIPWQHPSSLPVHPLQLYFIAAAFLMMATSLWLYPRRRFDGQVTLVFLFLFFATTFLIAHFRDPPLHVNYWLTLSLNSLLGSFLFALHYRKRPMAPKPVSSCPSPAASVEEGGYAR